jgi:TetR/AcrR family transcriptional repressor of nem operon
MSITKFGATERWDDEVKVSKAESERHKQGLLQAAGRLFRERGFEKVSIADIAAAAGLTHGAFYTHFASKEALCAEAIEAVIRERVEAMRARDREAAVAFYLSQRHVENRADGCALAALGGDVGRESPDVRAAFSRGLASSIQAREASGASREVAIASMATMVGALILARAVSEPKLRDEILQAARSSLLGKKRRPRSASKPDARHA